ncbi:MAG: hypothetical protein ACXWZ5_08840 [Mycobacterium sp.]
MPHADRVPGAAGDHGYDGVGVDLGAGGALGNGHGHPFGELTARGGLQAVAEHVAHPAVRP